MQTAPKPKNRACRRIHQYLLIKGLKSLRHYDGGRTERARGPARACPPRARARIYFPVLRSGGASRGEPHVSQNLLLSTELFVPQRWHTHLNFLPQLMQNVASALFSAPHFAQETVFAAAAAAPAACCGRGLPFSSVPAMAMMTPRMNIGMPMQIPMNVKLSRKPTTMRTTPARIFPVFMQIGEVLAPISFKPCGAATLPAGGKVIIPGRPHITVANYAKGARSERELIALFLEKGYSVVRAAGSGVSGGCPDLFAFRRGSNYAFECKAWKAGRIAIDKQNFKALRAWEDNSGITIMLAWKMDRLGWRFMYLSELAENDQSYSVTKARALELGRVVEDVLR